MRPAAATVPVAYSTVRHSLAQQTDVRGSKSMKADCHAPSSSQSTCGTQHITAQHSPAGSGEGKYHH